MILPGGNGSSSNRDPVLEYWDQADVDWTASTEQVYTSRIDVSDLLVELKTTSFGCGRTQRVPSSARRSNAHGWA